MQYILSPPFLIVIGLGCQFLLERECFDFLFCENQMKCIFLLKDLSYEILFVVSECFVSCLLRFVLDFCQQCRSFLSFFDDFCLCLAISCPSFFCFNTLRDVFLPTCNRFFLRFFSSNPDTDFLFFNTQTISQ